MKSFEEIYEKVCSNSKERLKQVKNKNNKFLLNCTVRTNTVNIYRNRAVVNLQNSYNL